MVRPVINGPSLLETMMQLVGVCQANVKACCNPHLEFAVKGVVPHGAFRVGFDVPV